MQCNYDAITGLLLILANEQPHIANNCQQEEELKIFTEYSGTIQCNSNKKLHILINLSEDVILSVTQMAKLNFLEINLSYLHKICQIA